MVETSWALGESVVMVAAPAGDKSAPCCRTYIWSLPSPFACPRRCVGGDDRNSGGSSGAVYVCTCAIEPPSTYQLAPETKLAAGLETKATTRAISSAWAS